MKRCKQAEALVCSGVISKSEFCRILPDSTSYKSRYELGVGSIRPLDYSIQVSL